MSRAERARPRSPWENAPTSELGDQVLPRWFVLLGLGVVAFGAVALIAGFVVFRPRDPAVTTLRPPPAVGYTHDIGGAPVLAGQVRDLDALCGGLDGVRVGGTAAEVELLTRGLAPLCDIPDQADLLTNFARKRGVVRFAEFPATQVDSAASLDEPLILVNARFSVTEPSWIAPLVIHDLVTLDGAPGIAETALAAREAELDTCVALFAERVAGPSCADASTLVAMDDPIRALQEAGYR